MTLSEAAAIGFDGLETADLMSGAIYESGRGHGLTDEALSKLLKVGNSGGFRWKGNKEASPFIVLTSTGNETDWPDSVTKRTLTYFGDQRGKSRPELLQTRGGNKILAKNFPLAYGTRDDRASTQVFLFFSRVKPRNWRFEGVALPGAKGLGLDETLKVVRGKNPETGLEFENFFATFTLVRPQLIGREEFANWSDRPSQVVSGPSEWELWVDNPGWWPSVEEAGSAD